ncbi:hypothetical protein PLESTB_001585500 [Pleodorina starrii]|uniref:Uncharacterized protein n=1 Tax=Pleodorina starrii TaxID=330485 RepID=A0A9W6F8C5_9CHLO|nr:hypothetical protein PLESTM_000584900 [Pleodorina starrii]GLC60207.1 hypothetical protein PLESTB_001585500 [Pleodorina starrii]
MQDCDPYHGGSLRFAGGGSEKGGRRRGWGIPGGRIRAARVVMNRLAVTLDWWVDYSGTCEVGTVFCSSPGPRIRPRCLYGDPISPSTDASDADSRMQVLLAALVDEMGDVLSML